MLAPGASGCGTVIVPALIVLLSAPPRICVGGSSTVVPNTVTEQGAVVGVPVAAQVAGSLMPLTVICSELNADWVKTSTGYGSGGATLEDLTLMRKHTPPHVQVKAAGGIRDLDTLLKVRDLGVTRCGASRTKEMLDDCRSRLKLSPINIAASPSQGY